VNYPFPSIYTCVKLCEVDKDCLGNCGIAGCFCRPRINTPAQILKQCGQCDPVSPTGECTNNYRCIDLSYGANCFLPSQESAALGAPCNVNAGCQPPLQCICNDGAQSGACNGVCAHACYPYDVGKPCPGADAGTCTLVPGTDFGYCK
jgi:hypothetical protein